VNFVKKDWSKSLSGVAVVLLLSQTAAAVEPDNAPPAASPTEPPAAAPSAAKTSAADRPADAAREARIKALETQLSQLSERVDAARAAAVPAAPPAPPAAETARASRWYDNVQLSAYVQAQVEFHQDSEDQLAVGGQPLNQNRFLLRRSRLKVESKYRYAEFLLELDANTVRGPSAGVQRAEVSAVYRGADAASDKPALIALTAGVLLPSFGREVPESPRLRPFMERSTASRAMFPSEPDVGVRLSGTLGVFNYGVSIVNGEPAGQPAGFPLRDPNAAKDILGRVGVAADVSSVVKAAGGVSLLNGTSTFRGTDGTKSIVTWNDFNEDGQINNSELSSTPGSAPSRSTNFKHWAVGADADVSVKTGLGQTELLGEIVVASNLDRGLFISDPITAGHDERQLGYNVALLQDITKHALLGFRYDYYDPRADVFGKKNGKVVPFKASLKTFSPLVGVRLPHGLRLLGQWDIVRDHLATDARGVPADRKNNAVTIRLQGEL
jgi:hypothetical protein